MSGDPPHSADLDPGRLKLARTFIHVAWLAIGLGLLMELAVIIATVVVANSPALRSVVADGVGKVSWSVFVCSGLAIGATATRLRVPVMGFLGLLAAPLAFTVARSAHKSAAQALAAAEPAAALPSIVTVSAVKGIEYAILGMMIGWLGRRGAGLRPHLATGLCIGIVFGVVFVMLARLFGDPPPPPNRLVVLAVNEVLFPVGCALVLYAAGLLGTRLAKS